MAYSWITPKTDWTTSTHFTYTDYNRIRNNLLFLNDKINELFPDKAKTLDLGDALTGYTDNYYPSQFNAFEDALESFTRAGQNVNIGTKGVYKGNEPFIMADALNRIEKCCLKWYQYDPVIHVDSISIYPSVQTIVKGHNHLFHITFSPTDAQDKDNWVVSSSNNSVLTVVKDGDYDDVIATGIKAGTANINVSVNKVSATAKVTVTENVVTQIIPNEEVVNIPFNGYVYTGFSYLPNDATNINDWSVISSSINVSAKKEDNNTIRLYGDKAGKSATITIKCGQAKATFTANVLTNAGSIWISNTHNGSTHLGGIGIWTDTPSSTIYFVTDPIDATDKDDYTYTVSDASVITVTRNADALTVVPLKAGQSVITVSLNGRSYDCKVVVTQH